MTRIIGIGLFRDEDIFVERAVRNVLGFCDELILVDHESRDGTPAILEQLAAGAPIPTALHRVKHPSASHDLVKGYAGQDVWVLGVDGDELYDPARLERFRPQVLGGEFDDVFQIRGNALHCVALDAQAARATGFLAPPSASMTKLYNFKIIEAWGGYHAERLHGGDGLVFKPPHEFSRRRLFEDWDDSPFRCLHLCFVRRSARETRLSGTGRESPGEQYSSPRRFPVRLVRRARARLGLHPASVYKREHYRLGELVTVDVDRIV